MHRLLIFLSNCIKKFNIRSISDYINIGLTVVKCNVSFFYRIFRVYFSRKEPRGGQRGILGWGKIRFIALNIRAMSQYGGGMGGVLSI